ncbi:GNAT family N-acetyltransferase [Maritimibacter sp. HL-12]|jgi:RimJ/RimL family protein N-acetyltransferase|uniref:GNAT family N-acetyltransferase n=1 Tax=Maritimibacter sp. HL-12 TaxID=1162418 RepID=UPI000A0F1372|nr:GNAT family N-acetyltransferase [Maritimibacter sp. HL-12]SMH50803.1 Protein N-acetyltransferase, RimJ/RimL family [Maritimibacter sp. HL-12]
MSRRTLAPTSIHIPTLQTARLTLRAARRGDFDGFAAELAKPRTGYMDGPFSRDAAWSFFVNDLASWALLGLGGLMLDRAGEVVGQVAIAQPPHFPEIELGWFIYEGHEGQGYATEAAAALRDWAFANAGLTTLVSYIDPGNAASIRLAERLGAVADPAAALPDGETAAETIVFRHPAPAALAADGMEACA